MVVAGGGGRGLEGEVGPELQAAVVAAAAMAGGGPRGAGDEEEDEDGDGNVDGDGELAHLKGKRRDHAEEIGDRRSEIGGGGEGFGSGERQKVFDEMGK